MVDTTPIPPFSSPDTTHDGILSSLKSRVIRLRRSLYAATKEADDLLEEIARQERAAVDKKQ